MACSEDEFKREMHIKFLLRHLHFMPTEYSGLDSNRMTLLYFVVSSLDLMGELDRIPDRQAIKDFVYSCQITPAPGEEETSNYCGFRGSTFFGNKFNPNCEPTQHHKHDQHHIAMTYTALVILRILGDDLSKVNKKAIARGLKELQQPDGSFSCVPGGSESDMRFVYCACVISHMLGDWSGIDEEKAYRFILSSQAYDGGIAQGPYQESHGGSTYCAVQALKLLGKLNHFPRKRELIQWCLDRQQTGFQGRINKVVDTCYSFWIGASLHVLDAHQYTNFPAIQGHSLSCQQKIGGFSKWPETYPDVLHTYFSLCGLALGGSEGLAKLDCTVGCTERASGEWMHTR
jgi:geranylgeranyl transferase type-1 subunit beta